MTAGLITSIGSLAYEVEIENMDAIINAIEVNFVIANSLIK
ncbi:hypothetical protein GCM10009409_32500 [Shewanella saliphila]|uniref:Uncharacterized protein n=1 Tax=Shewanella saliphila TaxID=2282698 RepID=A0ABQ2QA62_9GAMM|nr:hypothetical protein GCM10009409_32500 [Shewanella saliphila]